LADEFKDAPVSITEFRAEKEDRASAWTPRDALIQMLREIDSGKCHPLENLVICFSWLDDEDCVCTSFKVASKVTNNLLPVIGLLERCKWRMLND
jgi:hypothetical protein